MHWIVIGQHKHIMSILVHEARIEKSALNNIAIKWSASGLSKFIVSKAAGHLDLVRELLKDPSVDPSAEENYAIRWAAANGHVEVVRELLRHPKVNSEAGIQ